MNPSKTKRHEDPARHDEELSLRRKERRTQRIQREHERLERLREPLPPASSPPAPTDGLITHRERLNESVTESTVLLRDLRAHLDRAVASITYAAGDSRRRQTLGIEDDIMGFRNDFEDAVTEARGAIVAIEGELDAMRRLMDRGQSHDR